MSVLEIAQLRLKPGGGTGFEEAFATAIQHVRSAPGHIRSRLTRDLEAPDRYVFLVTWAELADHTERFAQSPAFAEFGAAIGEHLAEAPHVIHVVDVIAEEVR